MTRDAADSCPGVLRLHSAADGPLARIRLPGGQVEPAQLQVLAQAARELANGSIELTSRGNVQLRQVRDAGELTARLDGAGLLPSHTHERVRNILASPLSGRIGGSADVHGLAAALDAGLRADARLAELPGRVLFTLDDGRGDISDLHGDIGVHATGTTEFALVLAGRDTGVRVPADDAVGIMLTAAHAFLDLRADNADQWRLHDISDGPDRVVRRLGRTPDAARLELGAAPDLPIGWLDQDDGLVSLGAGVRLGCLPARTAEFIAAVERPVFVTPWRSVIIADLAESPAEQVVRVLAPMGLIFDSNSPWLLVSACAGRPGCAKSRTDVRADVTAAVESDRVRPIRADTTTAGTEPLDVIADERISADEHSAAEHSKQTPSSVEFNSTARREIPTASRLAAIDVTVAGRQHWSGCDRRCGRPRGVATDVIAMDDGYRVD